MSMSMSMSMSTSTMGGEEIPRNPLTPQLMVCYLLRRHYALSQVRVS
jgi:hypothetical protein